MCISLLTLFTDDCAILTHEHTSTFQDGVMVRPIYELEVLVNNIPTTSEVLSPDPRKPGAPQPSPVATKPWSVCWPTKQAHSSFTHSTGRCFKLTSGTR